MLDKGEEDIFMLRQLMFEQGPIRPPSESHSLLLRTTRGCPWNKCTFCSAYTNQKFSLRSVEDVKEDIKTIKAIVDEIVELSVRLGYGGTVSPQVYQQVAEQRGGNSSYMNVAMWLYHGAGDCFLQDGDNIAMRFKDLVEVLQFLRTTLHQIRRVTTYSRSKSIARRTPEELCEIHAAGLDRIHVGLESGCDAVLDYVKKGTTGAIHIEAGRQVVAAGMELSVYIIPGLGGKKLWQEHARDTAGVINQINPHFIRLRSLRVPERIPLYKDLQDGTFEQPSDDMIIEEIRLFIESLQGITSTLASDHILNILGDINGVLPADKEKMLAVISEYEALPADDKIIFRIGRRGGAYNSLSDLYRDEGLRTKINKIVRDIDVEKGADGVEAFIKELADTLS